MLSPPTFLAIGLALLAQNTIWGINEAPTRAILYLWSALQIAIFILLRNIPTYIFLNTIFHSVFLTTTAIRRLYFHPLSSWPGHKRAALTKLYEAYLYFTGINALEIRRLHRSHGDFLRTGPNEVAINNVEALQLYSRQNFEITRGPFYKASATVGDVNLISTRESSRHKTLRGIWEQAFKTNAVKEYSPRVELHVDRFIENLKATEGKPFDCVPVICNMTFDMWVSTS
jgi:integrase